MVFGDITSIANYSPFICLSCPTYAVFVAFLIMDGWRLGQFRWLMDPISNKHELVQLTFWLGRRRRRGVISVGGIFRFRGRLFIVEKTYFCNVGFGFQEVNLARWCPDTRRETGLCDLSRRGAGQLGRSTMQLRHMQSKCISNILTLLSQPRKFHLFTGLLLPNTR